MPYVFNREPTAKFKFRADSGSTDSLTLAGINATLASADSICAGVSMLMAIGGNTPVYSGVAVRTVNDNVNDDE